MKETDIKKLFAKNSKFPSPERIYGRIPQLHVRRDISGMVKNSRMESNVLTSQKRKLISIKKDEPELFGYHTTHRWNKTDKENTLHSLWNFSQPKRKQKSAPKQISSIKKNGFDPASSPNLKNYLTVLMKSPRKPSKNLAAQKSQTVIFPSSRLKKPSMQIQIQAAKSAQENSHFYVLRNKINDVFSSQEISSSNRFGDVSFKERNTKRNNSERSSSAKTNKSCSQFIKMIEQTFGTNFEDTPEE